ncbi:MAG: growth inhibitor PemK [Syntrophus sp. (in: bacteria)]|nr:growth inhibitor PemK [Syntrophus sp. (in: bacteria)]
MTKHKVVLVPFPFDDLSSTKVRPAVCLTDSIGVHKHTILAFITSRVPDQPLPSDLVISNTDENFPTTGLRVSSTLQLHRMITVTTGIILRELGELPEEMKVQVNKRLKALFGIK